MKYHINPDTGAVGVCSAEFKCQFGVPIDKHFADRVEAHEFFDFSMREKALQPLSKKMENPKLSDVLDLELLQDMVASGYVRQSVHPLDEDLKVLCYDRVVQEEGKWNDVTKMARGLIIRSSNNKFSDGVVIQRPWAKFFTLQQIESGWSLGDDGEGESKENFELGNIDFNAPAEVTDKMDGSMLILYRTPDGKPAFSTKASFKSDPALKFTKFMQNDETLFEAAESLLNRHGDTTFTFEGTGSGESQIVLSYDKDEITLLGAIKKKDGLYKSASDYRDIWSAGKKLKIAEKMPASTLGEALALPDRKNREGVVVRVMSDNPEKQLQLKIKQADYLALHKQRTVFSKATCRKIVREIPATFKDWLKVAETKDVTVFSELREALNNEGISKGSHSDWINNKMRETFENSILPQAERISKVYNIVQSMPDEKFGGEPRTVKANFFKEVNKLNLDKAEHALLLSFFDDRLRGKNTLDRDTEHMFRLAAQQI